MSADRAAGAAGAAGAVGAGAGGLLPDPVTEVDLPLVRLRSGKVREVFDLGERLLLVATDRISAFDCVFEQGIPGKGAVLTGISRHWFEGIASGRDGLPRLAHHLISADAGRIVADLELPPQAAEALRGRTMLVRRTEPILVECVVRGYLEGSALQEYRETGAVSGHRLPPGLRRADRLRDPIFTPARKALTGHDENVTFDDVVREIGAPLADRLRDASLRLYRAGAEVLAGRGLLLADTKFEFGLAEAGGGGEPELLLIDEVLTPDSSRFWEAARWEPGRAQPSFDKQPLRDYLEGLVAAGTWDKRPPAPPLPEEVVRETAERYADAHRRITGRAPEGWPADGPGAAARRKA
jgi:phosphoribosylaminoimidazole-succinocarboxamide synthase